MTEHVNPRYKRLEDLRRYNNEYMVRIFEELNKPSIDRWCAMGCGRQATSYSIFCLDCLDVFDMMKGGLRL